MAHRMWTRRPSNLRGDVAGGVTAAPLGIPLSMGYGVVAVTALGDDFTPHGVAAGLACAILVPLTAVHQIHDRLARDGRHLLISHLHPERLAAAVLRDPGVTAALTDRKLFADTDRALEWAEDRIVAEHPGALGPADEIPLEAMDVLAGLDAGAYGMLRRLLVRREYRQGEIVFREGDEGRDLFLIARGSASVTLRLPGQQRENRLATFSPGTVFGELALFDREPRSATIEADEDLVCYVLTEAAFTALRREHPAIALSLLANLGGELSRRLRRANRMIYQLES